MTPTADWKAKILKCDVEAQVERWDDPGPEICGAGGRLPSYNYMEVSGSYDVQFSDPQMSAIAFEMEFVPAFAKQGRYRSSLHLPPMKSTI